MRGDAAADIASAWKLNMAGCSLNPSTLSGQCLERVKLVAAGVLGAFIIGGSLAKVFGFGFFLFGIVRLGFPILASSLAAYYGYIRGQKVYLAGGLFSTYLLAYGVNIT